MQLQSEQGTSGVVNTNVAININKERAEVSACHAVKCIAAERPAKLRCDTCHNLFHGECLGYDSQILQQFGNIVHITGCVYYISRHA